MDRDIHIEMRHDGYWVVDKNDGSSRDLFGPYVTVQAASDAATAVRRSRGDCGSCILTRPDAETITIAVRSAGDLRESIMSMPIEDWNEMIKVEWNPQSEA